MNEVMAEIIKFQDERNWSETYNPKDLALSLTLEAAELLELFQWRSNEEAIEAHYEDMKDELADVLIYALTFAHDLDINVKDAILNKIKKNGLKYPVNNE